ncbi:MAG: hypothetical protein WC668_02090 [Patescibacteria group bacterium]|jgi:hypothetical protein
MKKIISKISDWCKNVCAKREGQSNFKRGLIIGLAVALVIVIILALVLWLSGVWGGGKDDSQPANPIAEAKVIVLTSTHCGNKCWDTSLFIDALKSRSIKITDVETLKVDGWWPWSKGKALAKKLQVTKVPTVVVETDFSKNPDLAAFFSSTLGNTVDNQFVLTKILAPYYDLALNKLKGEILVTYLTDESCKTCYDVKTHVTALENLGVPTSRSKTVDVSSSAGKALVDKYKITKVPTILISGEVSEYLVFTQAWADVGIVADDGTYIFTNLDLMGDYKDLTTGKEIKADATKASGSAAAPITATTK